jgi:hypothetical protein
MLITRYSYHILMKLEFFRYIFEKYSINKVYENLSSSGSRVVSCGRMDRQGDMPKLMVAFRNFSKAHKYQ